MFVLAAMATNSAQTNGVQTSGNIVAFVLDHTLAFFFFLFLQSNDQPGIPLVLEALNGLNYQSWGTQILMALAVKNKSGFVDGTVLQPISTASPALIQAWTCANALLLIWLVNSLMPEIRSSILYIKNACELSIELVTRYTSSDGPIVYHLEKSLGSITQVANSIASYYANFKTLWDEFLAHRPVNKCTCRKC